jgi:hypothetical protein
MTRTAIALTAAVLASLYALPAQAQVATRVFVSGSGNDSNPCTFAAPCRTLQKAFNTAPANAEIDVLDPAGYGPLTITHGISIQGHGFGSITQGTSGANAITINAGASDAITLNGLLLDGTNTGQYGIEVDTAGSVQILNCVIRHFFDSGVVYQPGNTPNNLLVSDTVASDNGIAGGNALNYASGIAVAQNTANVILSGVTANNNKVGVTVNGYSLTMILHSVLSNNSLYGLLDGTGTAWLAKSAIFGNGTGVFVGATVNSYGDNDINGNGMDVSGGSLTPISKQ